MGLLPSDLISMENLDKQQIIAIMELTSLLRRTVLANKSRGSAFLDGMFATHFFETSNRASHSFEAEAKYLEADVPNVKTATSIVTKGESLKDTGLALQMMGVGFIV